MGLAPSLNRIYGDAHLWFRIYVDNGTYAYMFAEADGSNNGSIPVGAIQEWIAKKAVSYPDSCWSVFLSSGNAIMMSHKSAATNNMLVSSRKEIDISDFKSFLIHLYAMSVLWKHFASADQFTAEHHSGDLYRKKLNMQEFFLACKSLCDSHGQDVPTKKLLKEEFRRLDDNCDGLIGFVQICTQFCRHIETPVEKYDVDDVNIASNGIAGIQISTKASKILGLDNTPNKVNNVMGEFSRQTKGIFAHLTGEEKTSIAMDQVKRKLDQEDVLIARYHTLRLHGEDSGGFSAYSQGSAHSVISVHDSLQQRYDEDSKGGSEDRFPRPEDKYGKLNDGSRWPASPHADSKLDGGFGSDCGRGYKCDFNETTYSSVTAYSASVKRDYKDSM